jgi:glutamate carboxypeptidase
MMAAVNPYASYLGKHLPALVDLIGEFVECESPSDSPEAVNRFVDLLVDRTRDIADASVIEAAGFGRHLRLEFRTQNRHPPSGQILALGHSDTVWTLGTLREMPFRQADGRLWGPGVFDMKAGIAFFLYAVRMLIELQLPVARRIVLLLVSDEEVGSPSSRPITEKEAAQSDCVLVLEPGTGSQGKLKTARKGIGHYVITVAGRASHAGVDFENGASAIVELARQIPIIAALTDLGRGLTVNPGVVRGGTRSNVVSSHAQVEVDVRVKTLQDWAAVDARLRALKPFDTRCELTVEGSLNRPPMVRSPAIGSLFDQAQQIARDLGFALDDSETGGGSDGNFTAALGIPTLDGLGAVGEGAHARNESIFLAPVVDRVSLLAALLAAKLAL